MKEIRYFYVPQASSVNELPEEEAKHAVKVLRLQAGDTIHIVDGEGGLFEAEVTMASGQWVDTPKGSFLLGDWQTCWFIFATYALVVAVLFGLVFRTKKQ